MMVFLQLLGIFSSVLMYENIRLLLGNFRMKQQGVDFELLLSHFKHIATHGAFTNNNQKPWLSQTFSSSAMVGIIKHLYTISLVMFSATGLILCQYAMDNLFKWVNGGKVYAIQLMPEAKLLVDSEGTDHQSFAGSYFSLSVGLGITMAIACLYAIIFRGNRARGGRLQGIKCLIVVAFMVISTMSFLKPYLHMTPEGDSFSVDEKDIKSKFAQLEKFTVSFGFSLGILAYSTVLC